MKICVLQPDYGSSDVDYKNYDPPRNLAPLLPEAQIDHVFLDKRSTYRQLKALKAQGYDIFVNLCEAYLEWDVPSIDVVHALEMLNLPYTGPTPVLYDPPKPLMKYVACTAGVATPAFVEVTDLGTLEQAVAALHFPLFVKPAKAGDSLGISAGSLVQTQAELRRQTAEILEGYDSALVEEYIAGREFTVLVAGQPDPAAPPGTYRALEFVFPEGHAFKTYDLKITQWHPECNVPCSDDALDTRLRDAAGRIFQNFGGVGYARLDFRVDADGGIFFLEINFTCSVFYPEKYEGSADYILKYDAGGQAGFLRQIIAEGLARHGRRQKKYTVRGNAVDGYGLYAVQPIGAGEVIWPGEERAQRIVTHAHVKAHWPPAAQETFRRYAYPVSEAVFILWDDDPSEWAPQNHSCNPNSAYRGLNVVALRDIAAGEELTLDYADFLDEHMEPFTCRCGAPGCRGIIHGTPGNNVTRREAGARSSF